MKRFFAILAITSLAVFAACQKPVENVPVTGVELDRQTLDLDVEQTAQLTATVLPSAATDRSLVWSSNDPGIATVENGWVTALATGSTIVKVATGDGDFIATCVVTATKRVAGVSISPKPVTLTLYEKETEQLTAIITPADADDLRVEWFSSAPEIADVDQTGLVTAFGPGQATVTALTKDRNKIDACVVTVGFPDGYTPVESVALDKDRIIVMTGGTLQLTPTILPATANAAVENRITWSSSKPEVVSVDQNGLATALTNGQADIYITTAGENKTAYCRIFSVDTELLGDISFRTTDTWTVGNQVWSDVVMGSRCIGKTTFNGGSFTAVETVFEFLADCRESEVEGKKYHLYSGIAMQAFADRMCPDGWRVPTREDFIALNISLGGTGLRAYDENLTNAYVSLWGAEFNGSANQAVLRGVGTQGNYWSQTQFPDAFHNLYTTAVVPTFTTTINGKEWTYQAESNPSGVYGKNNGIAVRCVK